MVFSKAIWFDEEEIGDIASATGSNSAAVSTAEEEFIEKLKQGDARAFDVFVQRYTPDIYGLLLRLTEDPEEAGDLLQETFLRAFKAIRKFRGEAELKTWLFRIAVNQSKNRFRWWKRRMREKTVSLDAPVSASNDAPLSETVSANFASPEEDALQNERQRFLLEALKELPEIYREAVVLCDIEGLSYEEISIVLEINLGTVKSRIARGREELRRKAERFLEK